MAYIDITPTNPLISIAVIRMLRKKREKEEKLRKDRLKEDDTNEVKDAE